VKCLVRATKIEYVSPDRDPKTKDLELSAQAPVEDAIKQLDYYSVSADVAVLYMFSELTFCLDF